MFTTSLIIIIAAPRTVYQFMEPWGLTRLVSTVRTLAYRRPGNVAFQPIIVRFVDDERRAWDRTRDTSRNRHDFDDTR